MKKCLILFFCFAQFLSAQTPDAKEIVRKANELMQGETNESTMKMTIVRPNWIRSISFRTWTKGTNYSLALVTAPAKEKGQSFLKRSNEIWNWVPNIQRMIKLPPSMMAQGWMGSDFTNDELLKESSLLNDYTHAYEKTEFIDGVECYKIRLIPKPDAAIVWGALVKWISKEEYFQLKTDYYDEDQILVKTEISSNIKMMGNRKIPCHFELIPADKPGNMTILDIESVIFNKKMDDGFFSQQNMKKIM